MERYSTQTRLSPIRKSVKKQGRLSTRQSLRSKKRTPSTRRLPQTSLIEFKFLRDISKSVASLKPIDEDLPRCVTPKSGSGQLIKICPQFVYKGPSEEYQSKNTIYWDKARRSIKIDFYSMNLLIQTALKVVLKKELQVTNYSFNLLDAVSNVSTLPFVLTKIQEQYEDKIGQLRGHLTRRRVSPQSTTRKSENSQGPRKGGMLPFGTNQIRIEHWESIVRDTSDNWYMKSKKYSYNDPRFVGISFRVEDGYMHAEDNEASLNAYNRIFMNRPTKVNPTRVTLSNESGTFDVKCYAEANEIKIANTPLNNGTYQVSKTLLNIEEYLRLSVPSDLTSTNFKHQGQKWFDQIRTTLEWAYDKIQLHHCDVKAEQFLLDENGNAIVSDLDKATFTVFNDVIKKPVRIRLHRKEGEKGPRRKLLLRSAKNIGFFSQFMPVPTSMQFEPYPRQNVHYECLCYLSSYLLLAGGEEVNIDEQTYKLFCEELIKLCDINTSVFQIDLEKLIHRRKTSWTNRQNFMHASSCVVLKHKLKGRTANYSPKWNESLLNLKGELMSKVSLSEISGMIDKEYSHQERNDENNPMVQLKQELANLLKPRTLKDVMNEPYMKTFIIGGPECLDQTLNRFLASEDQDVEKAAKKFHQAIQWRASLNSSFDETTGKYTTNLTKKEFDIISTYLECRWGYDSKRGQYYYYEKIGDIKRLKTELKGALQEDENDLEDKIVSYRILAMEYQAYFIRNSPDTKLVCIYDLSEAKYPFGDTQARQIIQKLIGIGQNYYPELLHTAYISKARPILRMIIQFVQSIVDQTTRDKIQLGVPDAMPDMKGCKFREWCGFSNLQQGHGAKTSSIPFTPLNGTGFKVRSLGYVKSKRKTPSQLALYDCVGVKLLESDNTDELVEQECAKQLDNGNEDSSIPITFYVLVKLADSNKSLLFCFQRKVREDTTKHPSPLFATFIAECNTYLDKNTLPPNRFKVVINDIDGLNPIEKGLAKKPVLIHKHGHFKPIHGMPVITIDMDLFRFRSRVTEQNLTKSLSQCKFDVGFVIQGNTDEELPERMLGCVQFNKLVLDVSPTMFASPAANQMPHGPGG